MIKYCFCLLITFSSVAAQKLHHQMLSSQGTSKILPNGFIVRQTIGQSSVIGNFTVAGITYTQGFQQCLWNKYITSNSLISISTVTYPNPFISSINFQFSQTIKEPISISIFDINGRIVFSDNKQATNNILSIELPNLSSSNYLVKLATPNYAYYTQILKKQ